MEELGIAREPGYCQSCQNSLLPVAETSQKLCNAMLIHSFRDRCSVICMLKCVTTTFCFFTYKQCHNSHNYSISIVTNITNYHFSTIFTRFPLVPIVSLCSLVSDYYMPGCILACCHNMLYTLVPDTELSRVSSDTLYLLGPFFHYFH